MPKVISAEQASYRWQVAALPWRVRKGQISILLITSRTNSKWMLPKGWPMEGKSEAEAARLEALEEAGIEGVVDESPIGSYRYVKLYADGSSHAAQAIIYPLMVEGTRKQWEEMGERKRQWFDPADAASRVYEPDLARFLAHLPRQFLTQPRGNMRR